MVQEAEGLPEFESGIILGLEPTSWLDDIFDWIANAVTKIVDSITDWIARFLRDVKDELTFFFGWTVPYWQNKLEQIWHDLIELPGQFWSWLLELWRDLSGLIEGWFGIIYSSVKAWFDELPAYFTWLKTTIGDIFGETTLRIQKSISDTYVQFSGQLAVSMAWIGELVTAKIAEIGSTLETLVPAWLKAPGDFVDKLLDGVEAWFLEDIPGHSPRWEGIFESIFGFIATWIYEFPKWFFQDAPERVAYGLAESFKWVTDTIEPVVETFTESIFDFARSLGPMSPSTAAENFNSLAKVGMTAIAGLTGMTVAGELLSPLKRIGLGNLAAMVWDMTNYKMITGAFVGAMTYSMLQAPLRYYFNSLFTPMLLREADFTELLSRKAFSDPDTLQNPELSAAVQSISGGDGAAFEAAMIGYYGYRPEYLGLYRELANTRLGYFALAGVARTGFYDEAWFREALARTGYSRTASDALLVMMRELYVQAKLQPIMSQARKLYREGFTTKEKVQEIIREAIDQPTLADVRLLSMELEQEYETKSMALDISLRAFTRGVIKEREARANLTALDLPGDMIDVHLYREKLGVIRRISWAAPEESAAFEIVEE
jgi:hypothetical protein